MPVNSLPPADSEPATDGLLNARAAADFLDVHPVTLANWRVDGQGPKFLRIGPRNIRYRRSDLLTYLEESTVEPEAS